MKTSDMPTNEIPEPEDHFIESVGKQADRKVRARHRSDRIWFGLGTMGIVGWSVSIPVLFGIALGIWLDQNVPASFSWRLTLILVGFVLGCLNAWYWVSKEYRHMQEEREGRNRD